MPTVRVFVALALLSVSAADAQSRLNPSALEGVWLRVEQFRPDQTRFPAQPGVRIFSGGHYSWIAVFGEGPRPALPDSATATAAQLRAVWGNTALAAEAGTFVIQGQQLSQVPIAAKNPGEMGQGWYENFSFRVVGDTLYMTLIENPKGMVLGTQPTGKYVRVR